MHTFHMDSPYLKRLFLLSSEASPTIFQIHELRIVHCPFCKGDFHVEFCTPQRRPSGVFRCHQRPCTSNADDHVTLADG